MLSPVKGVQSNVPIGYKFMFSSVSSIKIRNFQEFFLLIGVV